MRLIFTVTNDLSFDQRMQRICRTLANDGHDVTLVGFVKSWSIPLVEEPFGQKRLNLFFRKGKLFFIEYNLRLFLWMLFRGVDAICSIDLDTLAAGYAAARIRRKPLVFDAHEFYTELPEVVGRGFVGPIWRALERFLLPKVKHNFTVSRTIADALEQRYGQPFRVLPNYPLRSETPAGEHEGYILYQGTLNTGRGLEALMEAGETLRMPIRIAGEGDLSKELRARAASRGADQVEFLGYLTPEALRKETQTAWLGFNLLENRGLSYYYSLANKFFDYLQAGLPQLAPDFPEYRRINERWEVAVLIDEPDPRKIAKAVQALREDPARWARMRANCLKAREVLCWENLEPEILQFYRNLKYD